ncbi:MAG: response regulator [Eubacteriaceae bacterium]
MRILVVDDEIFNITVAKDILASEFSELDKDFCMDPQQVLSLLFEKEYDIILLDIIMPKMNGIEVLKQIRKIKRFCDIPIIMLTSVDDKVSFKKCFEYGAKDYISKPIDIIVFNARLRSALQNRSNILSLKKLLLTTQQQNKELANLNNQLEETKFHMIQKEKLISIGELAAGVAHEINNPMGYISSNLETLSKYVKKISDATYEFRDFILNSDVDIYVSEKFEAIGKKYKTDFILDDIGDLLAESKEGAVRVTRIVDSLRNFSRGGEEDKKLTYPFSEIINEVLLITRNESKYVADIQESFDPDLDIYCNKIQIQQVLINLIVNSVYAIKNKQNSNERGLILVESFIKNNYTVLKISDNGNGIPEKIMTKIFDPFFTTKEVGSGTGLGLSISYDIIHHKHHGKIFATSNPDSGTVFEIHLPLINKNTEVEQ